MSDKSALIPNPALQPLSALLGTWRTEGKHPLMPGVVVPGEVTFEWVEGGAYVRMYSKADHPDFPTGIAIIGSDGNRMYMLYFDSREVSRKYDFSMSGHQWQWWRDDPAFAQRFTVQISEDGNTMTSQGEMRRGDGEWEGDLALAYTRIG